MLKHLHLIAVTALCALLITFPIIAQQASGAAGWIPEDFAGFIRVDMADTQSTIEALNIASFVVDVLQPARVNITARQTFDSFFPLTSLDIENATFDRLISGWLSSEVIVAYSGFDGQFVSEQPLLILPARDSFRAAGDLSPAIQGQDFLESETLHGATIYHGDQITIAITPSVILIGSPEDIEAALLTGIGESAALIDQDNYQAVAAALPENGIVTAYLQNESAANALNFVLNGGQGSEVVAALGEVLNDPSNLSAALTSGGVDAVGVSLNPIALFNDSLEINAVAHFSDDLNANTAAVDNRLLNFVPRSAMIVQSGSNGENALQFALNALPIASYAGVALGSFPINRPTEAMQELIPAPSETEIRDVVENFTTLLDGTTEINLESLFQQFSGSYVAALMPRPNNPLPVLNADADGLFVAQVGNGADTLEQIKAFVETLTLQPLTERDASDQPIYALIDSATGQSLLELTAVDDVIVAGTGNAVNSALRAFAGDNRLVEENRWQALADEGTPQWYFDIDSLYSVISPAAGGPRNWPVNQVAIRQEQLNEQLVQFVLTASLTLAQ